MYPAPPNYPTERLQAPIKVHTEPRTYNETTTAE
jgi:hypothetical protein